MSLKENRYISYLSKKHIICRIYDMVYVQPDGFCSLNDMMILSENHLKWVILDQMFILNEHFFWTHWKRSHFRVIFISIMVSVTVLT